VSSLRTKRRIPSWWTCAAVLGERRLTLPVFVLAMADMIPGRPLAGQVSPAVKSWLELLLATPVVCWGGWPFFVRAWQSVVHRSLNMFTLIGMGVGVAYLYSLAATLASELFPVSLRECTEN